MTQHKSVEAGFTPGPWFVSGVRFRMNGREWHSVNRYDQGKKQDENIACVGFDPRTGEGLADAHLIAAAPALYSALEAAIELLDDCEIAHPFAWNNALSSARGNQS